MQNMRMVFCVLALLPLVLGSTACSMLSKHSASVSPTECPTTTCRIVKEVQVGSGMVCSVNGVVGPPTFSAFDVGKPGVPKLNRSDASMLSNIMKYVHPKSLRFAFVGGQFVVFDSYPGLCSGGAPFFVLNGRCDENYAITDEPDATVGGGDMGCVNRPRPWIPHDKGVGSPDFWIHYDNSH